ncbi:unnamed protein product [Cuscuta epithymum]|uniref:FMN-binding split barrel n=1 Tax=Cuscuta epithymum TaxID=186058 RepID=A0AAV0ETJ3_9ASTE|nr:unnamed protein product [Cuscuta epithymum]
MGKAPKSFLLTIAEKSKKILASNWQGYLNTIKADAKGSKQDVHSSKVKYFVNRGKPYIWIPEKDLHNVNAIIDERGSLAVTAPFPGQLGNLLMSIKMLPTRVALMGDIVPLTDKKAALAENTLREIMLSECKTVKDLSYSVSAILSSSSLSYTSRSENLQELLDENTKYTVYKFKISSCAYIDSKGASHEVALRDIEESKTDPLSPFGTSLIDGINRSEIRRRALILFCITHMNENVKDAFLLSVDRKGFDVLGKVLGAVQSDGSREYQWKEFRITLKEEVSDVQKFCDQLIEMEEEALKSVSGFTGL